MTHPLTEAGLPLGLAPRFGHGARLSKLGTACLNLPARILRCFRHTPHRKPHAGSSFVPERVTY